MHHRKCLWCTVYTSTLWEKKCFKWSSKNSSSMWCVTQVSGQWVPKHWTGYWKGPTTICCKPVRRYHQLMAGSGYVKPVELSMHQLPQTTVKLPCTTDYTSCRVQHSLQVVGDDLWSPSEDNVAVVDAGCFYLASFRCSKASKMTILKCR